MSTTTGCLESKKKDEEEQEEAPDEWTMLAKTYTNVLVPSFAPIYNAVANELDAATTKHVLDFGCGPGEPTLTLLEKVSSLKTVIAVDSTKGMLEIAKQRSSRRAANEEDNRITFHHVRRDISVDKLKTTITTTNNNKSAPLLDVVVSTFVLHYVEFARRVELVRAFLELAPEVLFTTWGAQSKVGFLRAIKTFGSWKGSRDASKDICDIRLDDEDDGNAQSPRGSFTMARKETFQSIVDQVEGALLVSFETKLIELKFSNVESLLNFLPIPVDNSDCRAMWKLLSSLKDDKTQVILGDTLDDELRFPTNVVFCRISGGGGGTKRPKEGEEEKTETGRQKLPKHDLTA